jgi:hypothetical protein
LNEIYQCTIQPASSAERRGRIFNRPSSQAGAKAEILARPDSMSIERRKMQAILGASS